MSGLTGQQQRDYDVAVRIRDGADDLNVYLASWQRMKDRPGGRRALTEAVGSLDLILRAVYDLRQSLVSQGRQFDDAAASAADELLKRLREEKP